MRSIRIYHPNSLALGEKTHLSPEASHHVVNVLRLKEQQSLTLFDGQNHEYTAIITAIQKKKVECLVNNVSDVSRESKLHLHLAQGISKGDRMTYSLQKAVELGVSEYTPLWTQHAAFKWDASLNEKKIQQWQAIIVSACEQSGRNIIPKLNPITDYQTFLKQAQPPNRFILEPMQGVHWQKLHWSQDENNCTLLIGPEGGFSEQEIQSAISNNYQGLTLGPRILRTETAVVTALSIFQMMKGDL
ncbi:MAG: rRNA (uracil1498-N3)-methyltransferase [Pseudomonadota bacterium]|nr:rRNA (uracil1498-N3)-methyltransferase [Pseudomonadota bacterium]